MAGSTGGQCFGDFIVTGRLLCAALSIPASSITDAMVQALAGIQASKLQHQHQKGYAQESATDCASEARVVHVVVGATGTIVAFKAGAVVVAGSATTVAVDLKKNGTTCLSAAITLDNSQTARQLVSGSLSVTSLVAGDVLEIVFTLSGSSKPKGVFAQVTVREDAQ